MADPRKRDEDPCCYGHRVPQWIEEADASSMYEIERARNAMIVR